MYECQSVECAFTSPVIIESGLLVMYCMQFVMYVSLGSWCSDVVFLGAMYMLHMVMSLNCFVCILRSSISVVSVLMTCGVLMCVNVVFNVCDEAATLFVFSVSADGGEVWYLWCPGCGGEF